ncbi:MAG: hypothetical protein CME20_04380 [Gemmatimonadetes bacterium]|nr:hypothetical protein [Gemmatimonadota bacterium]|tara:strand:+ start:550 stop:888 length:339 start_codon:yes stop_codon:yes gene_type:complete
MREQIQGWLDKLRQGTLQAADLQAALDQSPRQQLLYLQAASTGVDSAVLGMALVCDGQVHEGPQDPADWPYQTVLAAINDGWRVVKFPELALLLQEDQTYGLGCEFILEKLA